MRPAPSTTTLEAFRRVLGPDQTSAAPELLATFSRDHSLVEGVDPSLVVYPQSREQLQSIVTLAAETNTALIPVSSGAPHSLGDTVPAVAGVIVDFSRMRRIIKLDAHNRLVRVEPGVTFAELLPQLDRAGQRLNIPLAPRANKSVLTSALEREVSIMPKYNFDFMDPLTTLEVVYGNGADFRTGSAAGPGQVDGTLNADLASPWGPGAIDYYRLLSAAQGTLGLVSWAVLRTEVKPQVRHLHFIAVADCESARGPIEQILRKRVADECLLLDRTTLATLLAPTAAAIRPLAAQLPRFTLIVGIAGYLRRPEERVAVYEQYLHDICRAAGLAAQRALPGAAGLERSVEAVIAQPWQAGPHWKLRRDESGLEIFFLCPLSRFPDFVRQMDGLVKASPVADLDHGVYVQPAVQGRGAQVSFTLPFNAANRAAVTALYLDASRALLGAGAFFSRPYGPWAPMVYARDRDGAQLLQRLKRVFDPAGILNPGKLCFP
ncbi:MAG: FAD-binding oxidoreductase [Gammaproteobacteria bacterium]|nr:FAD-binding oxidoreductase [Gammaproteobacteria bacterium]